MHTIPLGIPVAKHHMQPNLREVSIRVPSTRKSRNHNWQFSVPWQAADLKGSKLSCKQCAQDLTTIMTIKQLPSEHWAEMMEFWHCHKPHEDHDHKKDYNSASFDPIAGRAFVSDAYFRFHSDDVNACEHINADKIWKWQVAVDNIVHESHIFIAAILRELVHSHAIFSFMLESGDTKALVWIFNVEAHYTITGRKSSKGIKVYYSITQKDFPSLMATKGEIETVTVPSIALNEMVSELEKTNKLLPFGLRKMGQWDLGFLSDA